MKLTKSYFWAAILLPLTTLTSCDQKVSEAVGGTSTDSAAARAAAADPNAAVEGKDYCANPDIKNKYGCKLASKFNLASGNVTKWSGASLYNNGQWDGEQEQNVGRQFYQNKNPGWKRLPQIDEVGAEQIHLVGSSVVNSFLSPNGGKVRKWRSEVGFTLGRFGYVKDDVIDFAQVFSVYKKGTTPGTHAFINQLKIGGKPLYATDFRMRAGNGEMDKITFHAYKSLNLGGGEMEDACMAFHGDFVGKTLAVQFHANFKVHKVHPSDFQFGIFEKKGADWKPIVLDAKFNGEVCKDGNGKFIVPNMMGAKINNFRKTTDLPNVDSLPVEMHMGSYSADKFNVSKGFKIRTDAVLTKRFSPGPGPDGFTIYDQLNPSAPLNKPQKYIYYHTHFHKNVDSYTVPKP